MKKRKNSPTPDRIELQRFVLMLPAVYYALHILEELPEFADWSSRHFGETSSLEFAFFEIISFAFVLFITSKAVFSSKSLWKVLVVAAQIQFGFNSLFHLYSAINFNEYAPGMVTAGSLGLLTTHLVLSYTVKHHILNRRQFIASMLIGVIIGTLAIGALYI